MNIWEPGHILIETGDHQNPYLIENFELPKCWEKLKGKKIDWQCESDMPGCKHF